jgi:putative tryptophan/tyrosine transport system substrate-binding protein
MRRRDFIRTIVGSATAWPLVARAQQSASPVIGFLSVRSLDTSASQIDPFHRGLNEAGYAVGRNVAIEYRWAKGQNNLFPALAAELVPVRWP